MGSPRGRLDSANRIVSSTGTAMTSSAGDRGRGERPDELARRCGAQRRRLNQWSATYADEEQQRRETRPGRGRATISAGGEAGEQRRRASERALQRPRSSQSAIGQEGEALDLPDMLDAPRGGGAEGEGERRHDARRRMPAAVAEEIRIASPPRPSIAEHDGVDGAKARIGIEQREQQRSGEKISDCGSAICGWPENT